jgi:prepilin peptidase CpaA
MFEALVLVVFPLVVAYAAFSDLFTMTIANRVSLILIGTFLILAPMTGMGFDVFGWHLAAAGLTLAVGFGCFAAGWIGGGDAKFATAVMLWLGWSLALEYLVLFSLFGGLLTLAVLYFRGSLLPASLMRLDFVARLHDDRNGVPYGVALALAAFLLYPQSVFMQALVM